MSERDYSYPAPWCSHWGAPEFDLPKLWSILQYEGAQPNWHQAGAWQKTSELIDYYRSELQQKRDALVAMWPPDRSPAAQVFVKYVDDLLTSMDETASKAYANSQAISGITSALTDAKNKLVPLKDKWESYQGQEAAFLAGLSQQGTTAFVSWLPTSWQHGIADTLLPGAVELARGLEESGCHGHGPNRPGGRRAQGADEGTGRVQASGSARRPQAFVARQRLRWAVFGWIGW